MRENREEALLREALETARARAREPLEKLGWERIEDRVWSALDDPKAAKERPPVPFWLGLLVRPRLVAPALATLCVALALGVLLTRYTDRKAPVPHVRATVLRKQGNVEYLRENEEGSKWRRLEPGRRLFPGTRVRAGVDAGAVVEVAPSTEVRLSDNTQVELEQLNLRRRRIEVIEGLVRVNVNPELRGGDFVMHTSNAQCRVAGTVFTVRFDRAEGVPRTTLRVIAGDVVFICTARPRIRRTVSAPGVAVMLGDSLADPGSDDGELAGGEVTLSPSFRGEPVGVHTRSDDMPGTDELPLRPEAGDPPRLGNDTLHGSIASSTKVRNAKEKVNTSAGTVDSIQPEKDHVFLDRAAYARKRWGLSRKDGRIHGAVPLTFLRLSGSTSEEPWQGEELKMIAEFVSRKTDIHAQIDRPSVTMDGRHKSFSYWLRRSRRRGISRARMGTDQPERTALEKLSDAVSLTATGDGERFRRNVTDLLTGYFQQRYGVSGLDIHGADWAERLKDSLKLAPWQEQFLHEAERSYRHVLEPGPTKGREVHGIYDFLRISELMDYPFLLCDPPGSIRSLSAENMKLLRTYLEHGGCIYFANHAEPTTCAAARGFIAELIQERLYGRGDREMLRRYRANERRQTGYVFDPPTPQIFHPWTVLPMILPEQADVFLSMKDSDGNQVFADTLVELEAGSYVSEDGYQWPGVDNEGGDLPSGFYVYQAAAGLGNTFHGVRISRLRRLRPRGHRVFHNPFQISDIPRGIQEETSELTYNEPGAYGVATDGYLMIVYTEGYGELELLRSHNTHYQGEETVLRWTANVMTEFLRGWTAGGEGR